jgi:hypothetical protein
VAEERVAVGGDDGITVLAWDRRGRDASDTELELLVARALEDVGVKIDLRDLQADDAVVEALLLLQMFAGAAHAVVLLFYPLGGE